MGTRSGAFHYRGKICARFFMAERRALYVSRRSFPSVFLVDVAATWKPWVSSTPGRWAGRQSPVEPVLLKDIQDRRFEIQVRYLCDHSIEPFNLLNFSPPAWARDALRIPIRLLSTNVKNFKTPSEVCRLKCGSVCGCPAVCL